MESGEITQNEILEEGDHQMTEEEVRSFLHTFVDIKNELYNSSYETSFADPREFERKYMLDQDIASYVRSFPEFKDCKFEVEIVQANDRSQFTSNNESYSPYYNNNNSNVNESTSYVNDAINLMVPPDMRNEYVRADDYIPNAALNLTKYNSSPFVFNSIDNSSQHQSVEDEMKNIVWKSEPQFEHFDQNQHVERNESPKVYRVPSMPQVDEKEHLVEEVKKDEEEKQEEKVTGTPPSPSPNVQELAKKFSEASINTLKDRRTSFSTIPAAADVVTTKTEKPLDTKHRQSSVRISEKHSSNQRRRHSEHKSLDYHKNKYCYIDGEKFKIVDLSRPNNKHKKSNKNIYIEKPDSSLRPEQQRVRKFKKHRSHKQSLEEFEPPIQQSYRFDKKRRSRRQTNYSSYSPSFSHGRSAMYGYPQGRLMSIPFYPEPAYMRPYLANNMPPLNPYYNYSMWV